MLKNTKQEKFAQVWFETGNKSQAYRVAYPSSKRWTPKTVANKASELSKQNDVLGRFEELRIIALSEHGVTITTLLTELEEARLVSLAGKIKNPTAAITATMSKAKIVGLDKSVPLELNLNVKTFADMYE